MEEITEHIQIDSSDSNDSVSDDEQEQLLINRAEELERQISDNKYLYDVHLELVELYRKLGDLRSMRSAYERFHECFPLTPQIWLDWINDEKKLVTSDSDKQHILQLFNLAVQDYISVQLWQEYVQYAIGASSVDTVREIIEKGLQEVGLHVSEGSLLWDTFRVFELAHFSLLEPDTPDYQPQIDRIVQIFKRQLSVPLMNMEITYIEWEEWSKLYKIDVKPIEWGYKKALKTLDTFKSFEERLRSDTNDDGAILEVYRSYLKAVDDPSTRKCLYERAVARLCLNPQIWCDYCTFGLKFGELADEISTKSLRNCPWSEDLWMFRIRILELLNRDETEIVQCFEDSLKNLIGQSNVELWLTYLEYGRRNFKADEAKLAKLFQLAISQTGFAGDPCGKIPKWYGEILAKNGKIEEARRLWKGLMKKQENKQSATCWAEQIRLEQQFGDSDHCRNLYERAIANVGDYPEVIADDWLKFERECGNLETVLKCVEKTKELAKIRDKRTPKRKFEPDEPHRPEKRSKVEVKRPIDKDPTKTVFVSNLYPSIGEKKLKKFFPNCDNLEIVLDKLGKSRCYGYVQFKSEEEVMVALARDRELLDGRPVFISPCKPDKNDRKAATFKYSSEIEAKKLFVRGLPFTHTKEDVLKMFDDFRVKDVRLVLRKNGQSKGLAYVEFDDEEQAELARKASDGLTVGEHVITVAISQPPVKNPQQNKSPKSTNDNATTRNSKSRLQIPMIPRSLQVKNDSASLGTNSKKSNDDFRKMLGI